MASLKGKKGEKKGKVYLLKEDQVLTIGREEKRCDIVFEALNVSRIHAKIWRQGDDFMIEDEESRNKTYLNGLLITGEGPHVLSNGCLVRICDNEFEYLSETTAEDVRDESSSTVEATVDDSSKKLIEKQSAEKLALLLEIATELTTTFEIEQILPQIVDTLFKVFTQADRAFLVFPEAGSGELQARVIRTRKEEDISTASFSRSIVRRCLQSGKAYLCKDTEASRDGDMPDSVYLSQIRSVMCAPLTGKSGEVIGAIQLDTRSTRKFNEEDLKFLKAVAGQAALALENATRAGMERDLKLAHEIQCGFVPRSVPEVTGYEFAACYEPAAAVGGDYFDFIPLPDQRLAVIIGDVAGKGVSAALLMAKVSSAARFALLSESSAANAVTKLNRLMVEIGTHDKFVTLMTAIFDPQQHTVTLANAAHTIPFIYRAATNSLESALRTNQGGYPLGVVDDAVYDEYPLQLDIGDTLLFYSDGVTDALSKKQSSFGVKGIKNALRSGPFTPKAMALHLLNSVEEFSKGAKQFDDITIVTVGRISPSA